ncbi:MAG: VCBS repeat-containing protein, partial [Bacteroidales bacterium]|nr:VCBS repeat-containing protein [Bacteroidales bacterium]
LWTGCIDSLYVQLNDQNWSFMKAQQYYIGTLNWFRIKSIDLNEDSYPDFYMTGYNSNNKVKILWNNGDGTFSYLNPVGIYQPYCENKVIMQINPNPVHSRAIIQLNCVDISYISLKISDLQGFEVKSLMNNQPISKGINQITWDLTDNAGKRCCPGLYIITLTLNGKQFSQKLIFF